MNTLEKAGRTAWGLYLILSAPCAVFCFAFLITGLQILLTDNPKSVETPPVSFFDRFIIWGSLTGFSLMWALTLVFSHRFNKGFRALVPFGANIFPVAGFLAVGLYVWDNTAWDRIVLIYLSVLLIMLFLGLVFVGAARWMELSTNQRLSF